MKMKIADELEVLQKKIEDKQNEKSSLIPKSSSKTERGRYERPLSSLKIDVNNTENTEDPPERSSSLVKIVKDLDEIKVSLRDVKILLTLFVI